MKPLRASKPSTSPSIASQNVLTLLILPLSASIKNSTTLSGIPILRMAIAFPTVLTTESYAFRISSVTRCRSLTYFRASSAAPTMFIADRLVHRCSLNAVWRCDRSFSLSSTSRTRFFAIPITPFIVTSISFRGRSLSTLITPGSFSMATTIADLHWSGMMHKCMQAE